MAEKVIKTRLKTKRSLMTSAEPSLMKLVNGAAASVSHDFTRHVNWVNQKKRKIISVGRGKGRGCKCRSLMVKVHWPAQLHYFEPLSSPTPPLHHHPPLPILAAALRVRLNGLGCQISSAERSGDLYGTCKLWPDTREAHIGKPHHELLLTTLPTVAMSDTGNSSFRRFFIKAENHF